MKKWPDGGPEFLLKFEGIGEGYSSVISNGKYIFASGKIDTMDQLTCLDFEGKQIWQIAYGRSWDQGFPNTRSSPTIEEDRIYIINGMGELVCLNTITDKIKWKINVDEDYQTDWHNWACIDWNTGEVMYDEECNSKGEMVYADGMLYVYDEKRGNVGLVEPDPSGFKVISSFRIEKGRGQHWSHPYIYDGKMFLRHGDVLMVYSIQ